jgi:NitT/TauT family transport system substrate-binding protein
MIYRRDEMRDERTERARSRLALLHATPRRIAALFMAFGAAAALVAAFATGASGASSAPITVRLAYASYGSIQWPIQVAVAAGLEKKYGIHVVLVQEPFSPDQQWQYLESNLVDVSLDDWGGVLRAHGTGLNNIVAFAPTSVYDNVIIVPANSPITSLAQLKGKTIGVWSNAGADVLATRAAIQKKYHFDYFSASTVLPLAAPLLNTELESGQVDAAIQFTNLADLLVSQGKARRLGYISDLLHQTMGLPVKSPFGVFTTSSQKLKNPQMRQGLHRFMELFKAGVHLMDTSNSVWTPLAQSQGITDPTAISAFITEQRKYGATTFWNQSVINSIHKLFTIVHFLGGESVFGVSKFVPQAYTTAVWSSNS